MDFRVQQHRLSQLAARLNLMVALVFGLLVSNILVGGLAWHTSLHQKVEITPFSGSSSYTKSDTEVDSHYLALMSENFLYSRLNVTPETVEAHHKRLLSFVDSSQYAQFLEQLHREESLIKSKKISSHFELMKSHIDQKHRLVSMTGILKRTVGLRSLPDVRVTYTIQYQYHLGHLSIVAFTHTEEGTHA